MRGHTEEPVKGLEVVDHRTNRVGRTAKKGKPNPAAVASSPGRECNATKCRLPFVKIANYRSGSSHFRCICRTVCRNLRKVNRRQISDVRGSTFLTLNGFCETNLPLPQLLQEAQLEANVM
jgi:hypothetical protein